RAGGAAAGRVRPEERRTAAGEVPTAVPDPALSRPEVEGIMSAPPSPSPGTAPPNGPSSAVVVKRIRFVDTVPAGAAVVRGFRQQRACAAVEERADPGALPREKNWPEPTDQLVVVFVPRAAAASWQTRGEGWLAPPDHPDAAPP